MASKVMVKIPVTPFGQVNKAKSTPVNGEIVVRTPEVVALKGDSSKNDSARLAQLEQNIRFLQEQHTYMLAGLHKEIDTLRHKNRELQFQLVFSKGGIPSSPSSPEDDTKAKAYCSPKSLNVTPLQVEILEKELGELKIQMHDLESNNVYLCQIIDEQKKKLDHYEQQVKEIDEEVDKDLLRKIEDAEGVIRRLRRENSDLRRENASLNGGYYHHREGGAGQNRGGGRYRGGSAGSYRGNWFPPLHAQTYWHGGRGGERNGPSGSGGLEGNSTLLPSLVSNQGRRNTNNNHHHHQGEGKKYRNGQNRGQKP